MSVKTKIRSKGKKITKGSFRFKGQDYKLKRVFDGKKYVFAVGVKTKAEANRQKKSLKKRYKNVRIDKQSIGYFVYVRGKK